MAMFGMTDEKKSLLIQEIYQRPLIWKVTDAKYTDVPARWVAFEEIARALTDKELTFTSDMVKVAWKNMMDYYNQIRRRHDRALAAGVHLPESKWQFYDMMHFTRQDKPPVKRKYNWMEPGKILLDGCNSSTEANASSPANKVPKLEVVFDTAAQQQEQSARSTPRTKESERARIQAKREALRDTNATSQPDFANDEQQGNGAVPKMSSPRKVPQRSASAIEGNRNETVDTPETKVAEQGHKKATSAERLRNSSGRLVKIKKRRVKSAKPGKRGRPPKKKQSPANLPSKTSKSPQALRSGTIPAKQEAAFSSPRKSTGGEADIGAIRPLSNFDSTSIFARKVAARLFVIKSRSPSDYARVCQEIDKVIRETEVQLDVADVVGKSSA